jgi:CubicO group peptidase (beta-lactamase class C family)
VYLPLSNQVAVPGRPTRGSHPPGTHWYYNNWDFNVLGNIYERATHKSIYLAFEHHLALPLELQDWDVYEHSAYVYSADPLGGNLTYANYTFALSAGDLARFGQLYLQHGSRNANAVLPSEWVRQSTRPLVATSLEPGVMRHYGHGWWVAGPGAETDTGIPADAFTARGLNGNFGTVIPTRQLVIVVLVDRTRAGTDRSATGGLVSAAVYSRLLNRLVREPSPRPHAAGGSYPLGGRSGQPEGR